MEWVKRAVALADDILSRKYNDRHHPMFLIHLHALRVQRRFIYKKPELDEVRSMMRQRYGILDISLIPQMVPSQLPIMIKDFISPWQDLKCPVKIEWFYGTLYLHHMNDAYRKRYMFRTGGDKSIYPKVLDTMALEEYDAAFRLWMLSVENPGMVQQYRGTGYMQDTQTWGQVAIKMLSVVIDSEHVISATVSTY